MSKFLLDTNLYVRAFRSRDYARELERFYDSFAPAIYMSSIVLHELLVGASSAAKSQEIRDSIARPFERTKRVVTPTHAAWGVAGETLALLAAREMLELRALPKSLVHDCLIAASCREVGMILVTENVRDFERIRRFVRFEFEQPWPH